MGPTPYYPYGFVKKCVCFYLMKKLGINVQLTNKMRNNKPFQKATSKVNA